MPSDTKESNSGDGIGEKTVPDLDEAPRPRPVSVQKEQVGWASLPGGWRAQSQSRARALSRRGIGQPPAPGVPDSPFASRTNIGAPNVASGGVEEVLQHSQSARSDLLAREESGTALHSLIRRRDSYHRRQVAQIVDVARSRRQRFHGEHMLG